MGKEIIVTSLEEMCDLMCGGPEDDDYMDGQITITEWLQSKIKRREVMDLTAWINSQGKSQYEQIKDVIRKSGSLTDEEQIDRLTNCVSVYVLGQSMGYMSYLQEEGSE